ncbi:MAG: hypothetical protein P1U38_09720 [Aeromicrobium sp.]|uniref:hypothetical protein n=1 Tax=Aeromicrobium sp. TaxID=1871063 RepID=UPI00260C5AB9|nr:hypothetical protein [Aeromicrobium sp.]MDF1705039.1 hypothetical protein [Aeromicrobium sp.]
MTGPKRDIAIVNGEPVEVVNAAGVATICINHALGADVALSMLRPKMQPAHFAIIEAEVRKRLR